MTQAKVEALIPEPPNLWQNLPCAIKNVACQDSALRSLANKRRRRLTAEGELARDSIFV